MSGGDRIQCIIRTVDTVLIPQMCLKIFRRYPSVAASTNDPFHLFIDDTFDFTKFFVLYNQPFHEKFVYQNNQSISILSFDAHGFRRVRIIDIHQYNLFFILF